MFGKNTRFTKSVRRNAQDCDTKMPWTKSARSAGGAESDAQTEMWQNRRLAKNNRAARR